MWGINGIMSMSTGPSKTGPFAKGALHTLLGPLPSFQDKQFPPFKVCQNYQKVHSSPKAQEPVNASCNSTNKKKKKKRKRKKKKKNQTQNPSTSDNREQCCQWRRQRQISTTSEDSFVVFFSDDRNDSSELSENETVTTEEPDSSDSILLHKKVRFANESRLCEIHPMVMWSYAYQAARKGPWEEYARDRARFRMRVLNTEAEIGHVFSPEHRTRIYKERFS